MTASASRSLAKRLSKRIILLTTTVFVVAIIAVGVVSMYAVSKESKTNATRALNNSILVIEKVLTEVEASTNIISWGAKNVYSQHGPIDVLTEEMIMYDSIATVSAVAFEPYKYDKDKKYYMTLSRRDQDSGDVETIVTNTSEYDYLTMDWYQIPKLTGKPYWNEPSFDSGGSNQMTATYSMPLYNDEGDFFGVIRSDISLEWLSDVINEYKPYETAITLIISRSAKYLTHIDKDKILNETLFTDSIVEKNEEGIDACMEIMKGGSGIIRIREQGYKLVGIYAPLFNGWSALGFCSEKDYYATAINVNIILFIVAVIGLFALYFSSRKIISRVTQPITEFTYSAMNMSRGNFHAIFPEVDSNDEIKRLSDSLIYLQSTINRYILELKTTTSKNDRIENELSIANGIQMSMLTHSFPKHDKYDIYANLVPAKEIGGDLYDFVQDNDYLYFTVGDVSGKGVPAALFMSITRSAFRFVSGLKLDVAEAESRINDNFSEGNETGMFVTMFYGRINIKTLEMEYCNAGHNPIVIIEPDGTAHFLSARPNIAAGLFPGFPFIGEKMQLKKGTRLILYTDGVTEAETRRKDLYGEDRLIDFANNINPDDSSMDVVHQLMASVKSFTADNDQNDDITIMSIKV